MILYIDVIFITFESMESNTFVRIVFQVKGSGLIHGKSNY